MESALRCWIVRGIVRREEKKPLRGMVAGAVDLEASHGVHQIDDGSHGVAERAPRCHSKEAATGTRGTSTCSEDVAVPKLDGRRMTDSFD